MSREGTVRHQVSVKRVHIEDIKPGMVIARDVITSEGFVLLAKDTLINPAILERLMGKGISSVYIKEAVITVAQAKDIEPEEVLEDLLEQPQKDKPEMVSVAKRRNFGEFAGEYDTKIMSAEILLRSISEGAAVNIDELYEITNATFSKLKAKSDVLTYMSFLNAHSEYIISHSYNVSLLCNLFANWMKMNERDMINLTVAGLLHDIGKFKIPSEVLYKEGKLSNDEFAAIKSHAQLGYDILKEQNIPDDIKLGAFMHHERFDGSGYPAGIKGSQINDFARIIAICDTYDAMTANRAYRSKICPFDVIKQFEVDGYNKYDTSYLLTFLRNIAYIYFGSWVKLSNGIEGEVVYIHQNNLSRPVVRVGETLIDLQKTTDLSISNVL
ncbi:MAG: HD-GYP domain-containing protein [Defluviitaleaceae bacterium]|nr:HD-GYP domain-containing protein [Defluviitaleaceae bacterium]